jgi:hypothetical protein
LQRLRHARPLQGLHGKSAHPQPFPRDLGMYTRPD